MKICVIGGGPAGMAAAVSARNCGADEVVLVERLDYLGGVLPQCIHTGFGLRLYGQDYTGGEYAAIWAAKTTEADVDVRLSTTVMSVEKKTADKFNNTKWIVKCVSAAEGALDIEADALILASGCRERTLPQMLIPGSRPAGIYEAGEAQYMMNILNYLPGRSAVILGSGDIGLIMARRMTLEGIKVKMILGQEATGLARNIVQCVEDFDIPMRYGWTLVSTHGYRRLKGVTVARIGDDGKADLSTKEYIPCDTLLIAAGLIPDRDVLEAAVNAHMAEGNREEGLFICGNADYVHDLADSVTEDGLVAGRAAAEYLGLDLTASEPAGESHREEVKGRKGNMVCTVCPEGCLMDVQTSPFNVTGNGCGRGLDFARQEITNPKRVITSVVKTDSPRSPVVAVRTDRAIDKTMIGEVMKAIRKICVTSDTKPGDQVADDIGGSGAKLIISGHVR